MDNHKFEELKTSHQLLDLDDETVKNCTDEQRRSIARAKAEHDLTCPSFIDLLTNFHMELLPKEGARTEDNVLHANKRLASFTARAAYESDKLARSALRLSVTALVISIALGLVQLVVALLQLCTS